ncbi:hypothetical protein BS50DRAFT_157349 [Corynespora cassiicola Philippines]|uniref:Uncharacterized protein n=1 Tax=Corynespora cassiicola Philippines TaxID=1448308 RepID=A0A2T2N772_CORCC|nr:hypothetical protein BS50DRAFT_157349 [Corynespora cassiicola Philippines]
MNNSQLSVALDEFQQILTQDQKAQLKSYSSHTPTPKDIVSLTDHVHQSNSSRKSHVFASRLQGLLGSVQQYCNIVDTCAGPNQIAALVWGGIKVLILAFSNFAEYFDKLSERVAQLSTYCPRLSEYEKLFPLSIRLQTALSNFYAIVVNFCSKALQTIQEGENEVFRVEQRTEIEASRDFRSRQMNALQRANDRQIQKVIKEEERQKIRLLRLIPSHDYAHSLRQAQGLRCEGTCDWVLRKPEFQNWINQSGAKHLWCYGIPGCGKSVLSGYIVQHLKRSFPAHGDTSVIYYSFNSSEKKSLKTSAFLRCILHQAITVDNLVPDIQRRLEYLFEDQIGDFDPANSELEQLFCDFIKEYKCVFLIVDGIDELSEAEQRNVKSLLRKVANTNIAKLLTTTHAAADMSKVLAHCLSIQIKPEDLKDDIALFIQSQIDEHAQGDRLGCSEYELDLIKQKFLWANLQFKTILDAYEEDGTPNRIPELLESIPRGIIELYTLLLSRATKGPGEQAERAKTAFKWVMCSRQSLAIEELEEAVSITTNQKSWAPPAFKLDVSRLGRICANLVSYDQTTDKVMLAHHSVESFLFSSSNGNDLEGFSFDEAKAEEFLLNICLTYLSFTDFHQSLVRTSNTRNLETVGQPIKMLDGIMPGLSRPFMRRLIRRERSGTRYGSVDVVNTLRSELGARQSNTANRNFRMLEYCKRHWSSHSRYVDPQNTPQFSRLQNFVHGTHLPKEWMPWSSIEKKTSLPYWEMFLWSVKDGHTLIFLVWKEAVVEQASYWECFWREEGSEVFACACNRGNLEQVNILLTSRIPQGGLARPSKDELSLGLVEACGLGHGDVIERLLQEKADVNAAPQKTGGKPRCKLQQREALRESSAYSIKRVPYNAVLGATLHHILTIVCCW